MFQVRFHGRGGQGVVTAAELLASAAFREDRHAQVFPSFGSERMGAPVMSFCRIDDQPIRTREPARCRAADRNIRRFGLMSFDNERGGSPAPATAISPGRAAVQQRPATNPEGRRRVSRGRRKPAG
jgi:hypothetical protein